jgi:uncharacterized protein (TIGR03437 family)
LANPIISAVVNGGSFLSTPLAPGEGMSIFGSNLSASTLLCNVSPIPTTCNGTSVLVDGSDVPVSFASTGQINFIVPWEITGTTASVQVDNAGSLSTPVQESVAAVAPGMLTVNEAGIGLGFFEDPHGSVISNSNQAITGETITAFLVGLGAVTPSVADGIATPGSPPSNVNATVTATVGGVSAIVTSAKLSPGQVALYEVSFVVPSVASGSQSFVVSADGVSSQSGVTLLVGPEPSTFCLLISAAAFGFILRRRPRIHRRVNTGASNSN